jgi:hypothetical protein
MFDVSELTVCRNPKRLSPQSDKQRRGDLSLDGPGAILRDRVEIEVACKKKSKISAENSLGSWSGVFQPQARRELPRPAG